MNEAETATQELPVATAPAVVPKKSKAEIKRDKLGKDISYGMQQTLACFATDFIDPFVGEKIQQKLEPGKPTLDLNWAGEIAGDTAALFAFLGVQKYAPGITHSLSKITRPMFEKVYEKSGRKHLKLLHYTPGTPEYDQKLKEWKDTQSDNMGKTSVIAGGSILFNVGTQKLMGNPRKLWVITVGKLVGAAITMALMMGLRAGIPRTTQQLDDELNDRYFSPVIRKTQKLLGTSVDEKPEPLHDHKSRMHDGKSYAHREKTRREAMGIEIAVR